MRKIFLSVLIIGSMITGILAQPQFFEFVQGPVPEKSPRLVPRPDGGWYVIFVSSLPIGSIRNFVQFVGFDACGEEDDAFGYTFEQSPQFSLQDVLLLDNGEFWLAFLARDAPGNYQGMIIRLDSQGVIIESKIIRSPGDFYLYGLDINSNGNLVGFGNTIDPQDYSVIIEMNENGNLVGAKRIVQTVTWGNFMSTSDGGYMCRSGTNFYKVNQDYSVEWSYLIPKYYATNAPVEVSDGYIFSIYPYANSNPDQNMLIKLGIEGGLIWQTMNFGSTQRTLIQTLVNGNVMQIGNGFPEDDVPSHVVFTEVNPQDGSLVRQKAFNADFTREMTGSDFIQLPNGAFTFVGNSINYQEVIHGMTTPSFSLLCGDFFYAQNTMSDPIEMQPYTSSVGDQEIIITSTNAMPYGDAVYRDRFCFENVLTPPNIPSDTVLCMGDSLLADFRNTDYEVVWADGSNSKFRFLEAPGDYEVSFHSCSESISETISIEAEDCSCTFFVPNVITPNADNVNDQIQLLTNCPVTDFSMSIFDRWGSLIFQSNLPEEQWPGTTDMLDLPTGVYLAWITFKAIENNREKDYAIMQDITLLR